VFVAKTGHRALHRARMRNITETGRVDAREMVPATLGSHGVRSRDKERSMHTSGPSASSAPQRCDDGAIDHMIEAFLRTSEPRQIEWGADRLGMSRCHRAIPALLARLGDASVRDDGDVEDAVCSALVALSVMERQGTSPSCSDPSTHCHPSLVICSPQGSSTSRGATSQGDVLPGLTAGHQERTAAR
jgi:hypothetical protein